MTQMEAWALSVERRSMELTRTNRSLRTASEKSKKVTTTSSTRPGMCCDRQVVHAVHCNQMSAKGGWDLKKRDFFKAKAERLVELLGEAELAHMKTRR